MYCPDCGSDNLEMSIPLMAVVCENCNFAGGFREYLERFNTGIIFQIVDKSTKDKLLYAISFTSLGTLEFIPVREELQIWIETSLASYIGDLMKLLRKAFGEKVLIRVIQTGIDSGLKSCPICGRKTFRLIDDSVVCDPCALFRMPVQDYVASLVSKAGFVCFRIEMGTHKHAEFGPNETLPMSFLVREGTLNSETKSSVSLSFDREVTAAIEIRNGIGTRKLVIAIKPMGGNNEQINKIVASLDNCLVQDEEARKVSVVVLNK